MSECNTNGMRMRVRVSVSVGITYHWHGQRKWADHPGSLGPSLL